MDAREFVETAQAYLSVELFTIGGTSITLATVATVLLVLVLGGWGSKLVRTGLRRAFAMRGVRDAGTILMVQRLAHYAIMSVAVMSAFQTVGVDLDALMAAGAVFAVGFGLAMQSIAQNFVSGIILLVERSIRPGDILEVEGEVVLVEALTVRNTIVRTLDDDRLIVPNATLAQGTVRNYTKGDQLFRMRVPVGVAYESDVPLVMAVLEAAGRDVPWAVEGHPPEVLFRDFGDSALLFELCVWTHSPFKAQRQRSELRIRIWRAFKDAGITIAFPQLDVHLDRAVVTAIGRAPGGGIQATGGAGPVA